MKKNKLYVIILIFLCLTIYSGYLYSLRLDYLPWGDSNRDGLFFLAYYLIMLPSMIVIAFLKRLLFKDKATGLQRNSFFFYILFISLPAVDTHGSQISLGLGFVFCLFVSILVLLELYNLKSKVA